MLGKEFRGLAETVTRTYGDNPWFFLRELAQNSRDAGAGNIWVSAAVTPQGMETVTFADDGRGMTLDHARRFLFRLYASDKTADHNAAGKYGIGFWTILGFQPAVIHLQSRRGKNSWAVELDGELNVRTAACLLTRSGTTVSLSRPAAFNSRSEFISQLGIELREYCQYLRRNDRRAGMLPVWFEGKNLTRPMTLPGPLSCRFRSGTVEGAVGLAEKPHVRLYARGLPVWQGAVLNQMSHLQMDADGTVEIGRGLAPHFLLNGNHLDVTFSRNQGRAEAEKKLIRELCAAVPQDIALNGRNLERKPLLRRTLAQRLTTDPGPGGIPATVAIPVRGDVCRIWLLDQGIPWQAFTCASYHGLVFEAALESAAPPSSTFFSMLAEAAGRLYQWLAEHYLSYPEKYQARIEELLFKKARLGGDLHLLSAFTPFRLWRSQRRLNLEEVGRKAKKEILYALPHDNDPGLVLSRHAQALLLTPLQKDFLLNHMHMPLVTPVPAMGTAGKLNRLFSCCWRTMMRLTAALPHRGVKVLAADQIEVEENCLCRELESHWRRQQFRQAPGGPPWPLTVIMVGGRGLAPAFWLQTGHGGVLHLRRKHPLIRQALHCLRRNPDNSELVFAALAPDIFLTAGVH